MVSDDAHTNIVVMVGSIAATGQLLNRLDDGEYLVDLVHVCDALLEKSNALKPEPGIDVLLR